MSLLSKKLMLQNSSEVPGDYWIALLGGTSSDYGYGIAVDSSGNVYITGYTASDGAGGNDVLITKYNTSGVIQWQRTLGGTAGDYGNSIAVDPSGNVYVAGRTASDGAGDYDALLSKYNTSGVIQWQRTLGGTGIDSSRGIAVDTSGNVYVAGYTTSDGAGSYDILISKYNTSGVIQWQRTLGGTSNDFGQGIAVDTSGNVYVTGYTASDGAGGNDILISKYNTSGVIQWQRTLGGTAGDYGNSIAVDPSGNVYVAGRTASDGAGVDDILIAKYNTSGVIQWQRTLGSTDTDNGYGISVDTFGNVYVTGRTNSDGAGGYDILIAKYNTSGVIQWQRTLGGTGTDEGYGIAVDSSGNVYVTGYTASDGAGSYDFLIAKLPGDGSLTGYIGQFTYQESTLTDAASTLTDAASTLTDQVSTLTDQVSTITDSASTLTATTTALLPSYWIALLGGTGTEYGYGITVDISGNVYVAGYTSSDGAGGEDILIAKYNTSGAIQWQRTLGGTGIDNGYGITVDTLGNVYVTGHTSSDGAGGYDALITKYNTSGVVQWQRTLGGTGSDYVRGIAVDTSGNVYVAGYTDSGGAGLFDFLISKYNTSGVVQWQRTLGGTSNDIGYGIAVDTSGNVYVTGYTLSDGAGVTDILITKYNTSGSIQWQRTLGGTGIEYGYGIAADSSGNVYVTGRTSSEGAGGYDALIAKYNTSGAIQWQRTLGGTGSDSGYAITVDSSGNVYVTGYTASDGAGGNDVLIAKLPGSGALEGTYGSLVYQASTLTDAASTLTDAASTLTDAASTLTDQTATLTSETITIQEGTVE